LRGHETAAGEGVGGIELGIGEHRKTLERERERERESCGK